MRDLTEKTEDGIDLIAFILSIFIIVILSIRD